MTDETRNTDKSKATPDQPPSADSGALRGLGLLNPSRRRLTQAGLAAPLLVSLAARPVWGSTGRCSLSGDILSGNLSNPEKDHTCTGGYGCTPGIWMNQVATWGCTGYSPGKCSEFVDGECAKWSTDEGTLFRDVFGWPPECKGKGQTPDPPVGASLMDVLHACPGSLDWHAVGAVLNAACYSIDYGATVEDVVSAYDKARRGAVSRDLLKEVLESMNEKRACPINAHGDCDDYFLRAYDGGPCIPIEQ